MASSIQIIDEDGPGIEIITPRTSGVLYFGNLDRMARGWRSDDDPHKLIELMSEALLMAVDEGFLRD